MPPPSLPNNHFLSYSPPAPASPCPLILLRLSRPLKKKKRRKGWGSSVIMKVSHFSWQKRKRWLRGQLWNSPLFTLTSILFFFSAVASTHLCSFHLFIALPLARSLLFSLFIYLSLQPSSLHSLPLSLSFWFCPHFFSPRLPLQSCYASVSPLSLSPLSDSGSISSASRVILLSQWPITQSHCLSSGTDRISRICRPTRHTCSLLLARTLSLGHLSLRHGQTTCGFFFVCGKNK